MRKMDFEVLKEMITKTERAGFKCEYSGQNVVCRKEQKRVTFLHNDFGNDEKINMRINKDGYYVNKRNIKEVLKKVRKYAKLEE